MSHKTDVAVAEVVYVQEIDLSRLFMEPLGEPVLVGFAGEKWSGSLVRHP